MVFFYMQSSIAIRYQINEAVIDQLKALLTRFPFTEKLVSYGHVKHETFFNVYYVAAGNFITGCFANKSNRL